MGEYRGYIEDPGRIVTPNYRSLPQPISIDVQGTDGNPAVMYFHGTPIIDQFKFGT